MKSWFLIYLLLNITLFCQGGWEDDENVFEAASREALEEAGVKGTLNVGFLN
jgi:8-oxo-dGTP pyrophosphatase MutT (NUDIX family)